jgi:PAS domain S-box-containing protein
MTKIFNKDVSTLSIIRELTQQLNTKERELIVSNNRFRVLFDHAPIGIVITSNRIIMDANNYMYQTLGYTKEQLINKSARILYDSDESYDKVGVLIENNKEFTTRVNMKHRNGAIKRYTLKVTKVSTDENVASIYIEMRE